MTIEAKTLDACAGLCNAKSDISGIAMKEGLIRHKVYDRLRADIMSCALAPGQAFREGDLAERFGVSKSPIRDALQRLELEGLVEIEPRRGHRVAQISLSDAEDILGLREVLETGAVRMIATHAGDRELADLDRLRVADTSSFRTFAAYNREFHQRICDAACNRRLSASMQSLLEAYDRLCIVSLSSTGMPEAMSMTDALADHNAIIDALQARSASVAVRASVRHVKKSRRRLMRDLQARPIVA